MPTVKTQGITFDRALNAFKKRFDQSGVPGILKQRARNPAKAERKRAKEKAAMVRQLNRKGVNIFWASYK